MNDLLSGPSREIVLRPHQEASVEALRQGIRNGARRQILVAPTAYGKTECAAHIIQQSQKKGATAWFIVDRIQLVDQTSARFAQYGIDHGIVQADNIYTDTTKPVQVISAQTLEKRDLGWFPDLFVVDECHEQRKGVIELIEKATQAKAIGLSATPFATGMAEHWDGLVNGATVNFLLAQGWLAPLRIKACVAPDMTGAKIRKGEYAEEESAERGITIIGDVVQTWVEQTRKHFGAPAKTIVFSPSVKHGAELCRQFAEAGFNFQQISYLDKDAGDRREKIAEFRKPDSAIDGLVSCQVLTKGFDVSDIRCMISCRPYRKSFSSHIQELGRGMRIHPGKEYCLHLDHSGNVIRFAEDTAWLFEHGVDSLSDAAKRDSTVREPLEKIKRERFCGECGTQMQAGSSVCPSCGWERPQRGEIQIVQGELIDFEISTKEAFQPRQGLRADCLKSPRRIWQAALGYCLSNSRKGEDRARKWAAGIWCGIYPGSKLPRGLFEEPCDHASIEVDEWALIDREVRRFRKQRRAA